MAPRDYLAEHAKTKGINQLVNDLLKRDIELIEAARRAQRLNENPAGEGGASRRLKA